MQLAGEKGREGGRYALKINDDTNINFSKTIHNVDVYTTIIKALSSQCWSPGCPNIYMLVLFRCSILDLGFLSSLPPQLLLSQCADMQM